MAETREHYVQFFDQVDTDHSGFLEKDELLKLMKDNGYTEKDAENFMRACDSSGDGKVSKEEFLEAMQEMPSGQQTEASLRRCFRAMDKDDSGSIDKSELKAVFHELGEEIDDHELDDLVRLIDTDGDGQISYEEFIKVFQNK